MSKLPVLETVAMNRIAELEHQLAKANERVNDMVKSQNAAVYRAYKAEQRLIKANERVAELEAYKAGRDSAQVASEDVINKFAIEKKIEALESLKLKAVENIHKNWIVNPMNGVESPGVAKLMQQSVGLNTTMIDSEIKQLRKEQGE